MVGDMPLAEFFVNSTNIASTAGLEDAKHGTASDRHKTDVNKSARIFFFTIIPP